MAGPGIKGEIWLGHFSNLTHYACKVSQDCQSLRTPFPCNLLASVDVSRLAHPKAQHLPAQWGDSPQSRTGAF